MNLSPLPIQKFFDNNGRPLSGGKLFTYEAGTSIKVATYVDSTGVTPNTNPVILNFRGECNLWIDPQQAYKFVLSPADDTDPPTNPIWTVDNITAAPQAFDNAAVDTGSVNNISLNIPQISAPVAFTRVVFKAANTNTGPTTLQINGGTAHDLTWQNLGDFSGGEIQINGLYEAIYDGAQWQLQGPTLGPTQMRTPAEITAGITPSVYSIESHLADGVVRAIRYGFSESASASTNQAALAAAFSVATAIGGCIIDLPPGSFDMNADIDIPLYSTIQGAGKSATFLVWNHTGDGLQRISPINNTTNVLIKVRDLCLRNNNASNTGGGFVDVAGSFIELTNVEFIGWKNQVILDQSELVDVHLCDFEAPINTGVSVWLVNGPDHTPGALGLFTNRITVSSCQFNGPSGAIAIADDGGVAHAFRDNNFNGYTTHIRMAAADCAYISGGEFEAASGPIISFVNTTKYSGTSVGAALAVTLSNSPYFLPATGQSAISITNLVAITLDTVRIGNTSVTKIVGVANCNTLFSTNVLHEGAQLLFDASATNMNIDGTWITPNVQNGAYTFAMTDMSREVRTTGNSAISWTIPPNSSVPFPIGARIRLISGGGAVTVTRGSGVLLYKAGTLTDANYVLSSGSSLIGMADLEKYATNTWIINGTTLT